MSSNRTSEDSQENSPEFLVGETTRDAILDGRVTLVQPRNGPRTAIDAIFLAASIPALKSVGEMILEAGTGTGAVALALCTRVPDVHVTGVDVQGELLELARENCRLNGLASRIELVEHDVTRPEETGRHLALSDNLFDHVCANPPFFTAGRERVSPNPLKARAYSADAHELERWIAFLATMCKPGGTVTFIHRAEARDELLAGLSPQFGAIRVFPLLPREGEPPKRIIVQGVKDGSGDPVTLPGMVLHEADGSYTKQADDILRRLEPLNLAENGP